MQLTPLEKKRWELWILSLTLIMATTGAVIIFSLVTGQPLAITVFLGIFLVLFCAYVVEAEIKLQKIQRQLRDEQFRVMEEGIKISALKTQLKELGVLEKAMSAIGMETQPGKALDTILNAAMELFGADRGSIMLVDEASQTLVIASSAGIKPEHISKSRPKVGEGIAGWVVQTGEALLLPPKINMEKYKNFEKKKEDIRSGICAPLHSRNKVIGVICYSIVDPRKRFFTDYDLKLLTIFAQYATLVMKTADSARLR